MLTLGEFNDQNYLLNDVKLSSANYGDEPFLAELFEYDEGDKSRKAYIRSIEAMIRKSDEYKRWTRFIRETLSVDFICYHTGNDAESCSLEIHHHPYTLFDIVDMIMMSSKYYTTFDLCKFAMQLHYRNLVGFVPLCKSSHEKYHNGVLDIPIDVVEGNWRDLAKNLDVPDSIKERIDIKSKILLSNIKEPWAVTKPVYCNSDFVEKPVKIIDRTGWE